MDEIIAKLRVEDARPREAPPEPMTARVTKSEFFQQREPTPPPLNYHSPYLANRFYSQKPDWIPFPHISAASLETKALKEIASRPTREEKNSTLVMDDFQRIERSFNVARAITPEYFIPSTMSFLQKDELYQSIYIFSNLAKLGAMLRKGVSIDEPLNNSMGYACIHYAAERGNCEIGELLCEYGADPNLLTSGGLTPIIIAASKGHLPFLVMLRKYDGDINIKDTELGRSPLHWAVMHNQFETVKFLVEDLNMDIYEKDKSNRNAIQLARDHYKKHIFNLLKLRMNNNGS